MDLDLDLGGRIEQGIIMSVLHRERAHILKRNIVFDFILIIFKNFEFLRSSFLREL